MIRVSLCQRNKCRGILTWYARIFDVETKEIRYESMGTTKKTVATDLMLAKQAAGEFEKKENNSVTLGKVFEMYITDLESRGSNSKTLSTIGHSLDALKSIFNKPINEVTKKDVMEAFSESASKFKPSTYNNTKTAIKTAFKFAKDVLEVIDSNPAECLKSRRNTAKERDFWTMEQIDRILDATRHPKYRLVFAFMAFAGLRIHEVLKLRREDLRNGFIFVIGKGQKFAKIPISSRLNAELEKVHGEFDFSDSNQWAVNWVLKDTAKRALGDSFTGTANPHRFRHSVASNLIRAGVSVKSVQKLMRHSTIQTTLNIYSHLIEEDLAEDIEKMFTTHLTSA